MSKRVAISRLAFRLVTIVALCAWSLAAAAELTGLDRDKGLVLWLTFDDIEDKHVPDHSGRENHGVVKGLVKQVEGQEGKAVHTGNDGYIELPDSESLNITGRTVTIMAWVYPKEEMGFSDFLTRGDNAQTGTVLQIKEDNTTVNFYAGGWARAEATAYLGSRALNRQWLHIAGVRHGEKIKLYINGELKAETRVEGEIGKNNDRWNVGRNATHPYDRPTNGSIDEVRIYAGALTQEEIKEVMKAGKKGEE